jgi:hypothetical protein
MEDSLAPEDPAELADELLRMRDIVRTLNRIADGVASRHFTSEHFSAGQFRLLNAIKYATQVAPQYGGLPADHPCKRLADEIVQTFWPGAPDGRYCDVLLRRLPASEIVACIKARPGWPWVASDGLNFAALWYRGALTLDMACEADLLLQACEALSWLAVRILLDAVILGAGRRYDPRGEQAARALRAACRALELIDRSDPYDIDDRGLRVYDDTFPHPPAKFGCGLRIVKALVGRGVPHVDGSLRWFNC